MSNALIAKGKAMKLQQLIKTHQLGLLFQQGIFGIEKESQRIDNKGNILYNYRKNLNGGEIFEIRIRLYFY